MLPKGTGRKSILSGTKQERGCVVRKCTRKVWRKRNVITTFGPRRFWLIFFPTATWTNIWIFKVIIQMTNIMWVGYTWTGDWKWGLINFRLLVTVCCVQLNLCIHQILWLIKEEWGNSRIRVKREKMKKLTYFIPFISESSSAHEGHWNGRRLGICLGQVPFECTVIGIKTHPDDQLFAAWCGTQLLTSLQWVNFGLWKSNCCSCCCKASDCYGI